VRTASDAMTIGLPLPAAALGGGAKLADGYDGIASQRNAINPLIFAVKIGKPLYFCVIPQWFYSCLPSQSGIVCECL
jgi:hypothetical protein